jgi:hypothetical protein
MACVGGLALLVLLAASSPRGQAPESRPVHDESPAESRPREDAGTPYAPSQQFSTTIRRPAGPPTIDLQQPDPQGRVGRIACSTCHGLREPNLENRTPADLESFHQNMRFLHGNLACYACHNPTDADTLRLADSTPLEYSDVMTLCGQCHGTQARDYAHGAHGGMLGYWDLSRGPRMRNNCIDCHDPHVPKFPTMLPTFKPRDRFLHPHVPPQREAQDE